MEEIEAMRAQDVSEAAESRTEPQPSRLPRLAGIISRIEQVVEEETASIGTDMRFDLKASNARKSRYLYELAKAVKGEDPLRLVAEEREAFARLREKLARNAAAILAHLEAVTEVAGLIEQAIRTAEADGTYTVGEIGRV